MEAAICMVAPKLMSTCIQHIQVYKSFRVRGWLLDDVVFVSQVASSVKAPASSGAPNPTLPVGLALDLEG